MVPATPRADEEKPKGWQLARLRWIDLRLRFLGEVRRSELITQFGVNEITASRDLAEYRLSFPNNMIEEGKGNRRGPKFEAGFVLSASEVLRALTIGESPEPSQPTGACITTMLPPPMREPDLNTLAVITEAIHRKRIARITYYSFNSGAVQRQIAPYVLAHDGNRWHVRAFDRHRKRFIDFVLTRIKTATLLEGEAEQNERPEEDLQWMRIVELHLCPKPGLAHPEVVALEYGMTDGLLKIRVRAALAGYVLQHLNVDCTADGSLSSSQYHLWLKNRQSLVDVDNLSIAAGYSDVRP
jgi:predicted DNA-binding transcriptional regulator YafY